MPTPPVAHFPVCLCCRGCKRPAPHSYPGVPSFPRGTAAPQQGCNRFAPRKYAAQGLRFGLLTRGSGASGHSHDGTELRDSKNIYLAHRTTFARTFSCVPESCVLGTALSFSCAKLQAQSGFLILTYSTFNLWYPGFRDAWFPDPYEMSLGCRHVRFARPELVSPEVWGTLTRGQGAPDPDPPTRTARLWAAFAEALVAHRLSPHHRKRLRTHSWFRGEVGAQTCLCAQGSSLRRWIVSERSVCGRGRCGLREAAQSSHLLCPSLGDRADNRMKLGRVQWTAVCTVRLPRLQHPH